MTTEHVKVSRSSPSRQPPPVEAMLALFFTAQRTHHPSPRHGRLYDGTTATTGGKGGSSEHMLSRRRRWGGWSSSSSRPRYFATHSTTVTSDNDTNNVYRRRRHCRRQSTKRPSGRRKGTQTKDAVGSERAPASVSPHKEPDAQTPPAPPLKVRPCALPGRCHHMCSRRQGTLDLLGASLEPSRTKP